MNSVFENFFFLFSAADSQPGFLFFGPPELGFFQILGCAKGKRKQGCFGGKRGCFVRKQGCSGLIWSDFAIRVSVVDLLELLVSLGFAGEASGRDGCYRKVCDILLESMSKIVNSASENVSGLMHWDSVMAVETLGFKILVCFITHFYEALVNLLFEDFGKIQDYVSLEEGNQLPTECIRRFKPGQGFWEQWEHETCSGYSSKHRWVLKTGIPNGKISPWYLQDESMAGFAMAGSVMTAGLELGGASTGPSELEAWRISVIEDYWSYWYRVCLDGGLRIARASKWEIVRCVVSFRGGRP
ncbi:hypothetical protein L1987_61095 [Smallanthus sonchifolius]|uniref:Uncharacterized protein n=1 Tax=Smallanthus sonchifolius TaxID=185202 RepID=A0ACB9DA32_9ASTR|nr:hypothetical protein L1987_61095 [Smallanthus sonchifolius]